MDVDVIKLLKTQTLFSAAPETLISRASRFVRLIEYRPAIPDGRHRAESRFDTVADHLGIYSLTENPKSLLMWGTTRMSIAGFACSSTFQAIPHL